MKQSTDLLSFAVICNVSHAVAQPVARIEGITQRYGSTVALDTVTIDLPAGCMVGFIGPDGVG